MRAGFSPRFNLINPCIPLRRNPEIAELVRLVVGGAQPSRQANERRREKRYPFPYPIHLAPSDASGHLLPEEPLVVLGKNLSELGLDFYHSDPVAFRHVVASLPCGSNRWIGLLMDLSWCRFSGHGWYENGGKFLSSVESPLNQEVLNA